MRNHIYGFDALRAFSVTLVILSHIGIAEAHHGELVTSFFSVFNAYFGVKTFFVLSGFLITTLLMRERAATGGINVRAFIFRRAFRILPLYFLIIIIILILVGMKVAEYKPFSLIYGSALIYNFTPRADRVSYMNHLWSLAVEEQFYLIWPLIFAFFSPKRLRLIAFACLVIAICYIRMRLGYGQAAKTNYPAFWTIPAIYPIMMGCLMALCVDRAAPLISSIWSLLFSIALILSPLVTAPTPIIQIISGFGIAGVVGWIFLNQENCAVKAMDWGPIGYAGTISYGLYMWQGLLTGNGPYRLPSYPNFPLEPTLGALLAIPIAIISFHFFETPIRSLRGVVGRSGKAAGSPGAQDKLQQATLRRVDH